MENIGRFTSFELSAYAQRTYTTHGSHFILVKDESPLKLDRYLAIYDNQGFTGKTRQDFAKILADLPIGTKARVIQKGFGYRNQPYDNSFNTTKVTQDDWVRQD
jgi:hypothetical protein